MHLPWQPPCNKHQNKLVFMSTILSLMFIGQKNKHVLNKCCKHNKLYWKYGGTRNLWGKEINMELKRTTHATTDRVLTGLLEMFGNEIFFKGNGIRNKKRTIEKYHWRLYFIILLQTSNSSGDFCKPGVLVFLFFLLQVSVFHCNLVCFNTECFAPFLKSKQVD